jgi:hypothetical protein
VHRANEICSRDVKNFITAFVALEILKRRVGGLEHRSHGSISNYGAVSEGAPKKAINQFLWVFLARHIAEITLRCRCGDSSNTCFAFASDGYRLFWLE